MHSNLKFIYYNPLFSKQLFSTQHRQSFTWLILITFIFSYVKEINDYILPNFLKNKYFLQNYLDYLEILEHFIYILVGVVLLQVINQLNIKKTIIFSTGILLLTLVNIFILNIHNLLKIHLILISAASFSLFITLIIQILNYRGRLLGIIIFLLTYFLGFISANLTIYFLKKYSFAINISAPLFLTSIIFILSFVIQDVKKNDILLIEFNFSTLIKNLELTLLSAFVSCYIFSEIYWQYEVRAITQNLLIKDIKIIWLYMAASSIITTPVILLLARKYNKYFLNILFSCILLTSYICFIYLHNNIILTAINSSILGIALYGLLIYNLAVITEQFDHRMLNNAIILYFMISSLGIYFGIIAAEKMLDNAGGTFIIPSYWLIIIYLGYYILQFFKRRLYNYPLHIYE